MPQGDDARCDDSGRRHRGHDDRRHDRRRRLDRRDERLDQGHQGPAQLPDRGRAVRRGQTPLNAAFRNPTVIGALAVLITVLAVFLAYNANNGLPFVQSYRLTAQVPDAAALVPGNEVRIGGVRVGVVESIEPVTDRRRDVRCSAGPEARQVRRAAARGLEGDHPVALGARPQVPADHAWHLRSGLPGGLDPAAVGGVARAGRVRPVAQHLRRADAGEHPGQPDRVRQRAWRAVARTSTRRSAP